MKTILAFPPREAIDGRFERDELAPELTVTLKRLFAVRLEAQQAFERFVHQSEELNRDLDSALHQGREDLARRLIQNLDHISMQREALSLQVETVDRQCSRLRSRLKLLFQGSSDQAKQLSSDIESPRSPNWPGDWIDEELDRRKAALASRGSSKSA